MKHDRSAPWLARFSATAALGFVIAGVNCGTSKNAETQQDEYWEEEGPVDGSGGAQGGATGESGDGASVPTTQNPGQGAPGTQGPSSPQPPGPSLPGTTTEQPAPIVVSYEKMFGVNLAGAEFKEHVLPGAIEKDYIYPTVAEINYFVAKGMNTFRLPFLWERLQPQLFGDLNTSERSRVDGFVRNALAKGAFVILDPHNYARYRGQVIGESSVKKEAFADFWTKLALRYTDPRVVFGLMNEPKEMRTETWVENANAAIQAIRAAGAKNLILVPGNGWSTAHTWSESWYGTPNANLMANIRDPGNNWAIEVHQYLDGQAKGVAGDCASRTIGSERLRKFTEWAKQKGLKAFLGEFGGGRNDTCYAALDDMLTHVDQNRGVWIGWTYWAAGPWWGDYFSSLEPDGGDRPQLPYLLKHIR